MNIFAYYYSDLDVRSFLRYLYLIKDFDFYVRSISAIVLAGGVTCDVDVRSLCAQQFLANCRMTFGYMARA